eukprot:EG_transcript_28098
MGLHHALAPHQSSLAAAIRAAVVTAVFLGCAWLAAVTVQAWAVPARTVRITVPRPMTALRAHGDQVSRRQQLATSFLAGAAYFFGDAVGATTTCLGTPPQCLFEGRYSDPNHPTGYRVIVVNGDNTATIIGTDEAGGPTWTLRGVFQAGGLLIDFSPKGGPRDLLAKYEPGGIRFPDGNLWRKVGQ